MKAATTLLVSAVVFCTACGVSVDPKSVQVRAEAPLSAQVERVRIPKDAAAPTTFLVVEPVRVSERGIVRETKVNVSGNAADEKAAANLEVLSTTYRNYLLNRQRQISLQLTTALSGVGNFRLIDKEKFEENKIKTSELGGGRGPYLVRAIITECTEEIVSEKKKTSLPLIYRRRSNLVEGVVGLDVAAIDASSGEVVASVPVQGTFISASEKAGGGLIATITEAEINRRSTIDQALRAALNNAAVKLHETLYK